MVLKSCLTQVGSPSRARRLPTLRQHPGVLSGRGVLFQAEGDQEVCDGPGASVERCAGDSGASVEERCGGGDSGTSVEEWCGESGTLVKVNMDGTSSTKSSGSSPGSCSAWSHTE